MCMVYMCLNENREREFGVVKSGRDVRLGAIKVLSFSVPSEGWKR